MNMTILNQTFYKVNHGTQSRKPQVLNHNWSMYKIRSDAGGLRSAVRSSEVTPGQMHFHSFLYFFCFLRIFEFFLFLPFMGIFSSLSPILYKYLEVFFQVFQIISKVFFSGFRCGNSVDFLYGGLIVRVSSCLSAFRSFALHTFF